ncbi:mL40, partial [Diplonema papillatum]
VPQEMVRALHSELPDGVDVLASDAKLNPDDSPIPLEEEEHMEEDRMRDLRAAYLWWRDQKDYGPRAETVHRDFMQMKHEQEVKLYTIRRARHGLNDYPLKRQMIVAPVLRDDTAEKVMYRRR